MGLGRFGGRCGPAGVSAGRGSSLGGVPLHLGKRENVGQLFEVVPALRRRRVVIGLGRGGVLGGLAGVLPQLHGKDGPFSALDMVAATFPLGERVEGKITAASGLKLGELVRGEAVKLGGLADNFGICHGVALLSFSWGVFVWLELLRSICRHYERNSSACQAHFCTFGDLHKNCCVRLCNLNCCVLTREIV